MEQYISKSAIAAEIESKIEKYTKRGEESDAKRDGYGMYWGGVISCLNEVRTLCDTLEVKEVDLEEAARHYLLHEHLSPLNEVMHKADIKAEMQYHKDIENAFKAGFKLGLKAKDVNEIIKTAEDHAYFAGSENTREKLIGKACEWWEKELSYPSMPQKELKWVKCKVKEFRKAMEG